MTNRSEVAHKYLSDIPAIHTWDGGKNWNSGGFDPTQLGFFIDLAGNIENCRVIETGAGNSTIAFLIAGVSEIVSIAPDDTLFNRIRKYCEDNQISITGLEAIENKSEWALPSIASSDRRFHIGLIDGAHGWPNTFVDLNYIYFSLHKGGFLILDDVQLHSIKEMAKFVMAEEQQFRLVANLGKALVFEKLTDNRELGEWNQQKYIVEMTNSYNNLEDPNTLEALSFKYSKNEVNLSYIMRKIYRKIKRFLAK
jgi:hypothetical protein